MYGRMFFLFIITDSNNNFRIFLCNVGVNVINLSLRRFKNDSFGVGVEIAIGIETHAMALFIDFDSDPDIDFDGFSSHENFLS